MAAPTQKPSRSHGRRSQGRSTAVGLGLALSLLAGCSVPEAGDGDFPSRDASALDSDVFDQGQTGLGDAGLSLDDPRGTWLLFAEDHKCLSAVGTSVENLIWTTYRVEVLEASEVSGGGRTLRSRIELCAQDLSPFIGGLRTIVPPAIPAAVPERDWTLFVAGTEAGAAVVGAEVMELWGAAGITPEQSLPVDDTDPRLVDLDDDGRPGVSFSVGSDTGGSVCEVFVVQRTRFRLDGTVQNARSITGTFWSQVDKTILGSTAALCAPENVMVQSPIANRFVMIRVDGQAGALHIDLDGDGTVSCAELVGARSVLEGAGGATRTPPDNSVCH